LILQGCCVNSLFDFYLTKWYNYAVSSQGENPMLGKRNPQEPLFYYFNMADMISKNHILRLINKYVDFSFIRSKVKHLYSVLALKYLSACSLLGIFMESLQKESYVKNSRLKSMEAVVWK